MKINLTINLSHILAHIVVYFLALAGHIALCADTNSPDHPAQSKRVSADYDYLMSSADRHRPRDSGTALLNLIYNNNNYNNNGKLRTLHTSSANQSSPQRSYNHSQSPRRIGSNKNHRPKNKTLSTVVNTDDNTMMGDDPNSEGAGIFLGGRQNMLNMNQHLQKFVMPPLYKLQQPSNEPQYNIRSHQQSVTQKNADNYHQLNLQGPLQLYPQGHRPRDDDQTSYNTAMPLRQRETYQTSWDSGRNQQLAVKPEPSEYLLPVSDLQENPDPKYDPKPEDLNYRKLKTILGRRYDPRYMSAFRPEDSVQHPNGTLYFGFRQNNRGLPYGNRMAMYKLMNMNFKMAGMRRKIRLRVSRKIKRKIFKYLKAYTSCPVLYKWKNIGKRFWPSWILEGQCYGAGNEGQGGPIFASDMEDGGHRTQYHSDIRRFIHKRGAGHNDIPAGNSISSNGGEGRERRKGGHSASEIESADAELDRIMDKFYYDYPGGMGKLPTNDQTDIYFSSIPSQSTYEVRPDDSSVKRPREKNDKNIMNSLQQSYPFYDTSIDPTQRSCSIPPGMTCKPSTSISLTILRWYCQNWDSKSYCSWIFVQYPVIESCKCSI